MRGLLTPTYEAPEQPQGDSSWRWFRDLARHWPGWTYWETPDVGDVENTTPLEPDPLAARRDACLLPRSLTAEWGDVEQRPYDVAVTNHPVRALVWDRWLRDRWKALWEPPTLVWNVSTKFFGSPEVQAFDELELPLWALGYSLHPNVMPTRYALDRCREVVGTFCGPPLVDQYDRNTEVVYVGPDCDAVDEVARERPQGPLRLWYGGRFTNTKQGEKAVEQYVRYAMGGREPEILVSHVGDGDRLYETLDRYDARPLVNTYSGLSWTEAASLMSSCHVSIWWQSMEMFPSTPLEQMYAGLIVLLRSDGKERELFGDDYPFTFSNATECAALLRWVADNYEEAQRQAAWIPGYVRKYFDRTAGVRRVAEIARQHADLARRQWLAEYKRADEMQGKMRTWLEALGSDATMSNLLAAVRRETHEMIRGPGRTQGKLPGHLHWLVPDDYVDVGEDEPLYLPAGDS